MPYLVSTAFDEFIERITIKEDALELAETRRVAISELLAESFHVLDAFTTGSIARRTGLKGVSDVDAMTVLHFGKHIEGKSPRAVLASVQEALSEYDARIVKKNGQAVTLYFKTWPNVDIVPAKRVTVGTGYALYIPDTNTGEWIRTSPRAHDAAMAAAPLSARQLARMVKCWNRAHSEYLHSYDIQRIVLETYVDGADASESSWPWMVFSFFEKALEMTEPSTSISDEYELDEWRELRERLRRAKQTASDAWYAIYSKGDHEASIERCRVLFGDRFPSYG
jgi:hypothetical protein